MIDFHLHCDSHRLAFMTVLYLFFTEDCLDELGLPFLYLWALSIEVSNTVAFSKTNCIMRLNLASWWFLLMQTAPWTIAYAHMTTFYNAIYLHAKFFFLSHDWYTFLGDYDSVHSFMQPYLAAFTCMWLKTWLCSWFVALCFLVIFPHHYLCTTPYWVDELTMTFARIWMAL